VYRKGESGDQSAVGVTRGSGLFRRVLHRGHRLLRPFRFDHRLVDVPAVGDGDAPVGHRAFGVEGGGPLEGANRLVVVEREQERHPLVEIRLRVGVLGGDLAGVFAEAVELRFGSGFRFRRLADGPPVARRGDEESRDERLTDA
jgi:hypothetical protein